MSLNAKKLLFLVNEDWFFASHFLPMARAALAGGMEVVVATRIRDHRSVIERTGARLLAFEADRSAFGPIEILSAVRRLVALLGAERPDILHCIGLKSMLIGGLAGRITAVRPRIYAVTGLGFVGARRDFIGRAARTALRHVMRPAIAGRQVHYLCENPEDARIFGLDPDHGDSVTLVGGAGVDLEKFPQTALPPFPPLRVAVISRMLWSKGVDLAVAAVREARRRGADVTLALYGDPDPDNPKALPASLLDEWSAEAGIEWHGRTEDVAGVWARHHLCCLASRGGEGLPRTLLEAAACGRPMITSDVPGCRHFVRHGKDGLVVPADDPQALAEAILAFHRDPASLQRMGRSARHRVAEGFTERAVGETVIAMYRRLLEQSGA